MAKVNYNKLLMKMATKAAGNSGEGR